MAEAAAALPVSRSKSKTAQTLAYLLWSILVVLALGFILKYVFHHYLNYNPKAYDPCWPRRAGLLLHITGGTLALLTAPWQFFTGLRNRSMKTHPWTGRIFLSGVAMGVTGATYLAFTPLSKRNFLLC
jgi:disulfide bond formation protein DsbB